MSRTWSSRNCALLKMREMELNPWMQGWGGWLMPDLCEQELQLFFSTTSFLGTKENCLWWERMMILVTTHERSLRRNIKSLCLFRTETLETWNKLQGMLLSVMHSGCLWVCDSSWESGCCHGRLLPGEKSCGVLQELSVTKNCRDSKDKTKR